MKKKPKEEIELELSSMSDISFLLIIFFILTTSLARPWGKLMEMPSAATPPENTTEVQKIPSINLLADRILYTEGEGADREITMNELRVELYKKQFDTLDPKARMVVLEVGEDVAYERYFQVVTSIAHAGGVVAMISE